MAILRSFRMRRPDGRTSPNARRADGHLCKRRMRVALGMEILVVAVHNRGLPYICHDSGCQSSQGEGTGMGTALKINLAIWGMLICAEIKLAHLLL